MWDGSGKQMGAKTRTDFILVVQFESLYPITDCQPLAEEIHEQSNCQFHLAEGLIVPYSYSWTTKSTSYLQYQPHPEWNIEAADSSGHEVMAQGKQTSVVLELLGSMGVPKKWIDVSQAAGKKKK